MLIKLSLQTSDSNRQSEAIENFFNLCGEYSNIEPILWDMLSESMTNPDAPTDAKENDRRMFLHRRLLEFLRAVEPGKTDLSISLN